MIDFIACFLMTNVLFNLYMITTYKLARKGREGGRWWLGRGVEVYKTMLEHKSIIFTDNIM